MAINNIIFDINTYKLLSVDFQQVLIVGQSDSVSIGIFFKDGDNYIALDEWAVKVVFERPDGSKSNETLANKKY